MSYIFNFDFGVTKVSYFQHFDIHKEDKSPILTIFNLETLMTHFIESGTKYFMFLLWKRQRKSGTYKSKLTQPFQSAIKPLSIFMTLSFRMNFFGVLFLLFALYYLALLWQMVLPIKQKPQNKNSHTKFAICAQKSLLEFGNLILMCKNYCHCTWSSLQIFRKNPENRFRDMPKPENNYLFWVQQ